MALSQPSISVTLPALCAVSSDKPLNAQTTDTMDTAVLLLVSKKWRSVIVNRRTRK